MSCSRHLYQINIKVARLHKLRLQINHKTVAHGLLALKVSRDLKIISFLQYCFLIRNAQYFKNDQRFCFINCYVSKWYIFQIIHVAESNLIWNGNQKIDFIKVLIWKFIAAQIYCIAVPMKTLNFCNNILERYQAKQITQQKRTSSTKLHLPIITLPTNTIEKKCIKCNCRQL